ncbi:MAG TPA: hypothetical protein VJS92_06910 [Candidatus Polarisedimenticolaceae bacterium]|nr:hypothetical protein [Candidatus Polarisedimenticolaceae bacterium]
MLTTALLVLAAAAGPAADPAAAEVGAYKLTLATLRKADRMHAALAAAVAADPALRARLEPLAPGDDEVEGEARSLDAVVAELESVPELKRALGDAGLTAREYVVFSLALLSAGLAEYALEQGGKLPPDAPPALAANVAWYKANRAEVERFTREIRQLRPDDEGEDEDGE